MNKLEKPKSHIMLEGEQFDIIFIHNGECTLSAGINPLSNDWMWWWSNSNSMYSGNKKNIYDIVHNIRKSAKVILDTF